MTRIHRRQLLQRAALGGLGLSALPLVHAFAGEKKPQRILYFTRSAGYMHSVVDRRGKPLAFSETILQDLGRKHGLDVRCSQDGALFDGDLDRFDGFVFYTSGNLLAAPERPQEGQPMTTRGKQRLLDAVAAGKGFVGIHAATDPFRREKLDDMNVDPYLAMLGGEFIEHASQQKAKMRVTSPNFPGMEKLGNGFVMREEWYTFRKFAPDLHVILVQETAGMHDRPYERPPYPATWARMHGQGRVFYTSLGHREDVWNDPTFQQILLGGIDWALKNVDADVTPNLKQVTPGAEEVPKRK